MSEVNSEENNIETVYSYPSKDGAIVTFVSWANQGMSLSVTLSVKGVLYSGNIIGGWKWCDLMAEQVAKANASDENKETISSFFSELQNSHYTDMKDDFDSIEYIHLEGVRIYQGSQAINLPPTLWRFKIGEVDGFTVGLWSAS